MLLAHGHSDHYGGASHFQTRYGARVATTEADWKTIADAAASGRPGSTPAPSRDLTVREGEPIVLGDTTITPIEVPGHTPGALSWHWGSCDSGVCLRMVYADSLTPIGGAAYRFSDHPDYVAAYRAGLTKLADTECDILMTPHPSASNMLQRMSGKAPLRDSNACRDCAAKQEKALDEQLAKEQAR